jgi:hypothetical protein
VTSSSLILHPSSLIPLSMALPTYQLNSIPTVDEFNAFLRPKFTKKASEEEFPGFLRQLTDDQLSDELPNVKPQWQGFRDELLISAGTGLSVSYKGGRVGLLDGSRITIAPGTLALADNATNFVFVDETGVVRASTTKPLRSLDLAIVATASGTISSISDSRLRGFEVRPRSSIVKVFGGYGEGGDFSASGATTLNEGIYRFKSFTLTSTGTISVNGGVRLIVSGDVTIDGAITIAPMLRGARGTTIATASTVYPVNGNNFGQGNNFLGGPAYNFEISRTGSSGASGGSNVASGGNVTLASGGDGGGYLIVECGGRIVVRGTISASGSAATTGTINAGTGSTVTGAGGGSGGLIVLQAIGGILIDTAAIINVTGGSGSAALANPNPTTSIIAGGGGGGGGIVLLGSPGTISVLGAINRTGGAGGANSGSNNAAGFNGGGGAGFGGTGGNSIVAVGNSSSGSTGLLTVRTFLTEV